MISSLFENKRPAYYSTPELKQERDRLSAFLSEGKIVGVQATMLERRITVLDEAICKRLNLPIPVVASTQRFKQLVKPTPPVVNYVLEPYLPWVSGDMLIEPPFQLAMIDTDVMGHRFPKGTVVVVKPVTQAEMRPTGVYLWTLEGETYIGRLHQPIVSVPILQEYMLLTQDQHTNHIACFLNWQDADFGLYRVTHYKSVPGVVPTGVTAGLV